MHKHINKTIRGIKKSLNEFFNRILLIIKVSFILLLLFFIVLLFIIRPYQSKNNDLFLDTNDSGVISKEVNKTNFIESITPYAEEAQREYGVRPSVLVAQAALESNWGNSTLSKESNNYFGIKAAAKGEKYATREFSQDKWIEINASFRQYESLKESVLDYAHLLKNGTSWNSNLYKDEEIDVVYLATPNSYHAQDMKQILYAGKHVLCEKAITMNKQELDDVLKLATEKGLVVAEAMTIYHMPIYSKLKERIDRGEFGKLKLATAYFGSRKEEDPTNRFFNPDLGGGALLDIGVYALSFVQYFLQSNPVDFSTTAKLYETGVDEMSTITYTTEAGTLGTVTMAFRGNLPKQGIIVCENAFITINGYPSASEATIAYSDGRFEVVKAGDSKLRLRYEMENITQMILTGQDYSFIQLTKNVNYLMDQAALAWGMEWVHEPKK